MFAPICASEDIDVHPNPPGLWQRVVILGGWTDKAVLRRRWPHAAACGPLRTCAGIDRLLRNLLANTQVRVIVWDGPCLDDAATGKNARDVLFRLWQMDAVPDILSALQSLGAASEDLARDGLNGVVDLTQYALLNGATDAMLGERDHASYVFPIPDTDRFGARLVLPPPALKVEAPAPHGDPGERVAGDTLADVWPLVLHRAMRFGRAVPTQYGETREVLNLVSVVRDPRKTLQDIKTDGVSHLVLGLTYSQVATYYNQLVGSVVPEGAAYSYGSRMTGGFEPVANGDAVDEGGKYGWVLHYECSECPSGETCFTMDSMEAGHVEGRTCPRGHVLTETSYRMCWPRTRSGYLMAERIVDQFASAKALLKASPGTRAAVLTPWRASEDAGLEGGRPCLLSVTFRATPDAPREVTNNALFVGDGGQGLTLPDIGPVRYTLHMTVVFRSHDLWGGYPLNLAACCQWLVDWSRDLGMAVGTLTCLSSSAHIYSRDYNAANAKIEITPQLAIHYDQRSTWRVEPFDGEPLHDPEVGDQLMLLNKMDTLQVYKVEARRVTAGLVTPVTTKLFGSFVYSFEQWQRLSGRKPVQHLRAIATTPDGARVIGVFEHPTASGLRLLIERSGLCAEVGNAMFLGDAIARASLGV